MVNDLKINVGKLKNIKLAVENINITENIDTKSYGYDEIKPTSPFTFEGKIQNLGDTLELDGFIEGSVELVCSRCLEPFQYDFDVDVFEIYTNHPEIAEADEYEETNLFYGDEIDLTPQLLKQIFLEMPMKILCKTDCLGLCAECGANLNHGECGCDRDDIDIRFAGLKDLLNSMNKEV